MDGDPKTLADAANPSARGEYLYVRSLASGNPALAARTALRTSSAHRPICECHRVLTYARPHFTLASIRERDGQGLSYRARRREDGQPTRSLFVDRKRGSVAPHSFGSTPNPSLRKSRKWARRAQAPPSDPEFQILVPARPTLRRFTDPSRPCYSRQTRHSRCGVRASIESKTLGVRHRRTAIFASS